MKTVFPNREIPHIWAHKTQNNARGGNIFFEGDTIYSYGHHFPIARHVENKKRRAILFTTHTYSNTTAKHCNHVKRAIPNKISVFHVENPDILQHDENWKSYETEIAENILKASRAKSNGAYLLDRAAELHAEAMAYSKFFGLKLKTNLPKNFPAMIKKARETARIWDENRENRRKVSAENRLAKNLETLQRWLAGESVSVPYGLPSAYMRLEGDEIVTSMGPSVPLEHVRAAYAIYKRLIDLGETYQRNGHTIHLGNYALDSIDEAGNVRAGCHLFKADEIARIASIAKF